jgi:50S ribosomal subunit-associated GTPase HflX
MRIQTKFALLSLAGLLTATQVLAEEKVYQELRVEDFQTLNFTNKIDHFDESDNRTYTQRYFMNDQFWDKENGPVFLWICGEARCKPPTSRGYAYQIC